MAGPMHGVQLFHYDAVTDSFLPVGQDTPLPVETHPSEEAATPKGAVQTGNVGEKWKDTAAVVVASRLTKAATDQVAIGGNASGSNFTRFSMSAITPGTETVYLFKDLLVRMPLALELGFSQSQRFMGQEINVELVGIDPTTGEVIDTSAASPADWNLSANVTVATNVWNIILDRSTFGDLRPGDDVVISGCQDSRLNYGPVKVSVNGSSANNVITITGAGISDGTVTGWTGGKLRRLCPCGRADQHIGLRLYGTSNSNADVVSRNGVIDRTGPNGRPRSQPWNPGNTWSDSSIPSEHINFSGVQYTEAFRAKTLTRLELTTNKALFILKDQDSATGQRYTFARESELPDSLLYYALRFRLINHPNLPRPIGTFLAITAVTKTSSTTATVTCPGHGLVTGQSRVRGFGPRAYAAAEFPSMTADVTVTVLNADQFTCTWGSSGSATSYGGFFIETHGGGIPTVQTIQAQTYNKTYDGLRLSLVGSGTWTEVVGNTVFLAGLVTADNQPKTSLHGNYRVERISTTTIELSPLDGAAHEAAVAAAPSGATNCGGSLIRVTDFRYHFAKCLDFNRMLTDPASLAGVNSVAQAVHLTNSPSVTPTPGGGTWATATPATNRSAAVHWGAAANNADVTSSARTTSGNSGTISDDIAGTCAAIVNVTASSGTNPTLDIVLKESFDNGTTWQDAWHVERITGNQIKRVPPLPISGRRRWDWTIAGTSPSFTFTITVMRGGQATPLARCFYDRTANLLNGTASTNGAAFDITGCKVVNAAICLGAATTPGTYQLELSNDGANWTRVGTPTAAVANSTVRFGVTDVSACFARLVVTGAATGQTGTYASITAST